MKTKKYLLSCPLFILLFAINSKAQIYTLYGDKTFGGNNFENAENIIYTGNQEFILSGYSSTDVNGDKTDPICNLSNDVWLLKVDAAFNIIWQNDLGGNRSDETPRLSLTASDNRFIFSGRSYSDSTCDKTEPNRGPFNSPDYWLCMIDSNGIKIWDKTLGCSLSDSYPVIIQLTTGDFVVSGRTDAGAIDGDKTVANYANSDDYWTIKLDSLGNKLWDKVYGGTDAEIADPIKGTFCMLACSDAAFILAGATISPASGDITDTSRGGKDVWIIKLDSSGTKIWDKRFGGSADDYCSHIVSTSDNGYILCGATSSPQNGDVSESPRGSTDYWVIKLDSLGNKKWDRRYGGSGGNNARWIMPAFGGGYWVAGSTTSDSSFDVSEHSYGVSDYWIIKIDSAGDKIWDKRFGGPLNDYATSFAIAPDSSIYLFGNADSGISAIKTDAGKGDVDYWLVRFKYTDNTTGINETIHQNNLITAYPNPTKGKFTISFPFSGQGSKEKGEVYIYDVMGKEVYDKKNVLLNHFEIDVSGFYNGIYFLKVKDAKGNEARGKVVKE